jgi:hypothetical protein
MIEKLKQYDEEERERIEREEDAVTLNSDESFPASDPPSFIGGSIGSDAKKKRNGTH